METILRVSIPPYFVMSAVLTKLMGFVKSKLQFRTTFSHLSLNVGIVWPSIVLDEKFLNSRAIGTLAVDHSESGQVVVGVS